MNLNIQYQFEFLKHININQNLDIYIPSFFW